MLFPAQSCPRVITRSCSRVPWSSLKFNFSVPCTELSLSPDLNSWNFGTNCSHPCPSSIVQLSCIVRTVHHDTPPVKGSIMSTMRPGSLPSKVAFLTRNNVVKDDFDKTIAVRPHHFVNRTYKIGMDSNTIGKTNQVHGAFHEGSSQWPGTQGFPSWWSGQQLPVFQQRSSRSKQDGLRLQMARRLGADDCSLNQPLYKF